MYVNFLIAVVFSRTLKFYERRREIIFKFFNFEIGALLCPHMHRRFTSLDQILQFHSKFQSLSFAITRSITASAVHFSEVLQPIAGGQDFEGRKNQEANTRISENFSMLFLMANRTSIQKFSFTYFFLGFQGFFN